MSLIIINFTLAGMIMFFLGILGEYVARIFEEVLDRPRYLVAELINMEKQNGQ
jgi:dolichol-phosphate mannosyltransferase